jgi:hypothetical protein
MEMRITVLNFTGKEQRTIFNHMELSYIQSNPLKCCNHLCGTKNSHLWLVSFKHEHSQMCHKSYKTCNKTSIRMSLRCSFNRDRRVFALLPAGADTRIVEIALCLSHFRLQQIGFLKFWLIIYFASCHEAQYQYLCTSNTGVL